MTDPGDVTVLLKAFGGGDHDALNRLVELVYDDLRRIAHRHLRHNRDHGQFETTGLVHEAYLRLIDQTRATFEDRGHFFAVAALAMRQILVNAARQQSALKRGGVNQPVTLEEDRLAIDAHAERLLAIDEALLKLANVDQRLVQIVECRVFAGLGDAEIAAALNISERTVQRDWVRARAWLALMLGEGKTPEL
ncbi:MAG: ECF-type sigma factor [Acidobacteriota bacterium]